MVNHVKDVHPIIIMLYFFVVIGMTMMIRHPVFLVSSFVSGWCFALWITGWKKMWKISLGALPLFLLTIGINPLFSHAGVTILGYFPDGNPLTKESILYGVAAAGMLFAVLLWFYCLHRTLSTDQILYLSGKILPSLSLVISMALRFVPEMERQIRKIKEARYGLGVREAEKGIRKRWMEPVKIFSALLSWAFENSIDRADTMEARGYGLRGRTSFVIYIWTKRDVLFGILIVLMAALAAIALGKEVIWAYYYPAFCVNAWSGQAGACYVSYLTYCFLPIIYNCLEEKKWKRFELKM